MYALSASSPNQHSYACYLDTDRDTYLGDVFSIKWMEDTDRVSGFALAYSSWFPFVVSFNEYTSAILNSGYWVYMLDSCHKNNIKQNNKKRKQQKNKHLNSCFPTGKPTPRDAEETVQAREEGSDDVHGHALGGDPPRPPAPVQVHGEEAGEPKPAGRVPSHPRGGRSLPGRSSSGFGGSWNRSRAPVALSVSWFCSLRLYLFANLFVCLYFCYVITVCLSVYPPFLLNYPPSKTCKLKDKLA